MKRLLFVLVLAMTILALAVVVDAGRHPCLNCCAPGEVLCP